MVEPLRQEVREMRDHNVMPEVAKALGVELGEPFAVENISDDHIDWFRLTIDGAQHFSPDIRGFITFRGIKGDWCDADYVLDRLLVGKRAWIKERMEQGALF
jgi:hypothetical protein